EVSLADRDGLAESARLAEQDWQIVPEIGARLARSRPPVVASHAGALAPDLDVLGKGAQPEPLAGVFSRHRVAPAFKSHKGAIAAGLDRMPGAGQEGALRQGRQQRPLRAEALADRGCLTLSSKALLGSRLLGRVSVELGHIGDVGDGS